MVVQFGITYLRCDNWLHISELMVPLVFPSPAFTAEKEAQTQQFKNLVRFRLIGGEGIGAVGCKVAN